VIEKIEFRSDWYWGSEELNDLKRGRWQQQNLQNPVFQAGESDGSELLSSLTSTPPLANNSLRQESAQADNLQTGTVDDSQSNAAFDPSDLF